MTVNLRLSTILKAQVRAEDKQCFRNSVSAVLTFPTGTRSLRYVEGYAISKFGMVVLHGWVEYKGEVVETTPIWLEDAETTEYFPARKYTRSEIRRIITRERDTMLPLCGWGEPVEFREAYQQAMVAAYGEDVAEFLGQKVRVA